jgi:surfeit locus 1 family protein
MSSTPARAAEAAAVPGPRRFRFRPGLALATLAGLALLVGLGTWQLHRLAWKEDLIARAEAQMARPPVPLPEASGLAGMDFRKVAVRGSYLHDKAVAFGLTAADGRPGAHLVTPFRLEDGRVILVDRGWLPEDLLPPRVPRGLEPGGTVPLAGVVRYRADPVRNLLTPADRPGERRWFSWDIPALSAFSGAPLLPLVLVLARSEGPAGLPRTEPVRVDFRNEHLGYALTWYGLAAALLAVYLVFSFSRHDEPRP